MTKINLGLEVRLSCGLEPAVTRVTEALKTEGFGILTRIDLHQAFMEKLGETFRPYAILGACNPVLAKRAVSCESQVGLLLPCNVTVEETAPGQALVRIGNPEVLLSVGGLEQVPELRSIGQEAAIRLKRAAETLRKAG